MSRYAKFQNKKNEYIMIFHGFFGIYYTFKIICFSFGDSLHEQEYRKSRKIQIYIAFVLLLVTPTKVAKKNVHRSVILWLLLQESLPTQWAKMLKILIIFYEQQSKNWGFNQFWILYNFDFLTPNSFQRLAVTCSIMWPYFRYN